jgi:AMP deaminase
MDQSLQSPGDNPKDADDWTIYPKPPPPSYIPKKGDNFFHDHPPRKPESELFDLNDCSIPEQSDEFVYKLDSDGVYRVFRSEKAEKSLYNVPTAKEYFLDLDFILSIISEGIHLFDSSRSD